MKYTNVYSREFPALYRGVVEDNKDPENLGRCRVRVPSVHGELTYPTDILPWARPIVISPVSSTRGSVNIPDIGDIVWVFFEGAVKEYPVYIGGTYAKEEIDIDLDKVIFYLEGDDSAEYHRKSREFTVRIGDNAISISPEGINLSGNLKILGDLTVEGTIHSLNNR